MNGNVGRGINDLGAFLNEAQRDRLIDALDTKKREEKKKGKANEWRALRDRVITAAILGGGVKGGEVRGMSVSCVSMDGEWLEVRHGKRLHRTRLRSFAVDLLGGWVAYLAGANTEGTLLFPSTAQAKLKSRMMDKATLYRIVKRQFDAAGIELLAREAPQTLQQLRCDAVRRRRVGWDGDGISGFTGDGSGRPPESALQVDAGRAGNNQSVA